MKSVLLLNASYEPMKIISWQRAITMFFSGKVEVVEEYDHDIRSVSMIIKAPAVVRLLRYVTIRRRCPPLNRRNVFARDGGVCQYCNKALRYEQATLDHVIPRSKKGTTTWDNIVCCCGRCNRKKGNKTPAEAGMPLLAQPIEPGWLPVIRMKLNGEIPGIWQSFIAHWYQL